MPCRQPLGAPQSRFLAFQTGKITLPRIFIEPSISASKKNHLAQIAEVGLTACTRVPPRAP